jgi:GTP-binding protein HflX
VLHGNLSGLKPADRRRLERLYRRRIPPRLCISAEAARALVAASSDLNRQVGLLISRSGRISHVIVGEARGLFLPDLKDYPLGQKMLRGLRLVHTHLKGEPLNRDDLTDLALLRLDLIAAIGVGRDGLPGKVHLGSLKPGSDEGAPTKVHPVVEFAALSLDVMSFCEALEDEMGRLSPRALETAAGTERAILVSVDTGPRYKQEDSMEELKELARSSDVATVDVVLQRPARIDPRHLIGSGKLRELIIRAMQLGATMIVFDQDLTPAQGRRIAEATELKVIDRSQLILDIFARRAHSRSGKVQVELAQLKYRLPRLTGRGTAMSRLMGGIGGRGPGEMKLEIDRRRVRDRITALGKELKSISRGRLQRKTRRSQAGIPILSIVGYTNAGKSTLLNALTRSETVVEARMFATLDTASRRLRFPRDRDVIITDTVGFIRNLPRDLFNAFRATLEEMTDAHLLLHLVDVSNPRFEQHIASVQLILHDLGIDDKPVLLVFNKIDLLPAETVGNLCSRFAAVGISARRRETFPPLLEEIEKRVWPPRQSSWESNRSRA